MIRNKREQIAGLELLVELSKRRQWGRSAVVRPNVTQWRVWAASDLAAVPAHPIPRRCVAPDAEAERSQSVDGP